MPSGKNRTKEDTWKEADLKKALQTERKKERSDDKSKSSDRRSDRDDDKRRRRKEVKDDIANGDDKERERRRREKDSEREKRKDREKEGERPHRDKESRRDRKKEIEIAGEISGIGREDRGSGERDDKEHRRTRDKDSDREKRHRSRREHEESGRDEETSRDKERTNEKDKQRRRRREERESSSQDKNTERKRESSRERDHRERRKDREHEDLLKPRDENREKRRERTREKDGRERRKDHHDDGSRERREKSRDDKDRRRDHDRSRERASEKSREREERHRRKEKDKLEAEKENRAQIREKELLASLQKEEDLRYKDNLIKGEKFRADTLETADVIDEEENATGIQRKTSTGQHAEEITEEGGADDYDDDFEDYEDDFENEDDQDEEEEDAASIEDRNAGMQELLKAINLENETVRALSREGSKLSKSSDDEPKRDPPSQTPTAKARGRINFVAAKQKQISEKVASRTRKRGQELMHLIDLDVAVFEMFDLPPMNEYDLYIKNFGRSDTTQAYVQCNDDNLEKEIQTEEIETRTMWTQNPAENFTGCGGEDGNKDDFSSIENRANIDSVRLTRFLESAGQVCLVLLEEASADQSSTMIKEKKDMTCSDGYIPLATKQPYLAGRVIESIHISPVQSHLLLTAYGPVVNPAKSTSTKANDAICAKSVVCLWNVNEPSQPQKVLLCESVPRCCCLSPSKATIAFAGLEDGSVVSWDLRESSPVHHTIIIENTTVTLRPPTFSTAGVLSQDNHHSPVVSLRPVVMPGDSAKASSSLGGGLRADDMVGLSFQLASLEEDAVVNIWVVVELDASDIAGSESDLGLAPGGKIKLIKSASLTLELPMRGVRKTTALQAFCVRFLPQDPNHLYVGTDGGCVLHRIRHGGRAPPRAYKPQTDCLVDVTAIDISPFQLPCILAGSRDGSIRLYHLNNEFPRNTWTNSTNGSPIVSIQWSRSVPNVFYVLDGNSGIYIWDLLQNESSPVSVEKIKQGRMACLELSSDYTASGIGVPGRNPEMVLGYENGMVEVHKISPRFSKASPDELDRFHNYLETLM